MFFDSRQSAHRKPLRNLLRATSRLIVVGVIITCIGVTLIGFFLGGGKPGQIITPANYLPPTATQAPTSTVSGPTPTPRPTITSTLTATPLPYVIDAQFVDCNRIVSGRLGGNQTEVKVFFQGQASEELVFTIHSESQLNLRIVVYRYVKPAQLVGYAETLQPAATFRFTPQNSGDYYLLVTSDPPSFGNFDIQLSCPTRQD